GMNGTTAVAGGAFAFDVALDFAGLPMTTLPSTALPATAGCPMHIACSRPARSFRSASAPAAVGYRGSLRPDRQQACGTLARFHRALRRSLLSPPIATRRKQVPPSRAAQK